MPFDFEIPNTPAFWNFLLKNNSLCPVHAGCAGCSCPKDPVNGLCHVDERMQWAKHNLVKVKATKLRGLVKT